jgi:hypothetical protein
MYSVLSAWVPYLLIDLLCLGLGRLIASAALQAGPTGGRCWAWSAVVFGVGKSQRETLLAGVI